MFAGFIHALKKYGVPADVRTLRELYLLADHGMIRSVSELYDAGQVLVVKSPKHRGPYTNAFCDYFFGIETPQDGHLEDAMYGSSLLKRWFEAQIRDDPHWSERPLDPKLLRDAFLDHLFQRQPTEVKRTVDGAALLQRDDPTLEDRVDPADPEQTKGNSFNDAAADFRSVAIDELLERMQEVAKRQRTEHAGGAHWIGTGGISPYGHSGRGYGGIRVGGQGGGLSARRVLDDPRSYPVDVNTRVSDDTMTAALRELRQLAPLGISDELAIERTVYEAGKTGRVELYFEKNTRDKIRVILMIDNGGYSMDAYVGIVMQLFAKMNDRFKEDLKTYYFHNCFDETVYTDKRREKPFPTERLLRLDPAHRVFIVGDARMSPYELKPEWLQRVADRFQHAVWINPRSQEQWHTAHNNWDDGSEPCITVGQIQRIYRMVPLTLGGIRDAVRYMNAKDSNHLTEHYTQQP
ncbi:hypothetical protein HYW21_08405 [Candidatus Woesearchaeota archaeon]|nr:hypothetical protein [Candidatus Woesearchaeota archaeon]